MLKKLKSQKGMTLVELLAGLLISLMMAAMLCTSIAVAKKVYDGCTAASQQEILLDTLTTAISNEVRYATSAATDDGSSLTYTYQGRADRSIALGATEAGDDMVFVTSGDEHYNLLPQAAFTQKVQSITYAVSGARVTCHVTLRGGTDREFTVFLVNSDS